MHNQTVRHGRLSTIKNACNTDEMPYCVACALIDLMNEYWANTNSTQPIPNPGPVLDRIEDIALMCNAAELNGNDRTHKAEGRRPRIAQSDANDFYHKLLQQLELSSA